MILNDKITQRNGYKTASEKDKLLYLNIDSNILFTNMQIKNIAHLHVIYVEIIV